MRNVLVIAPHPDDEILGCGGSLLRWVQEGARTHWAIVTAQHTAAGFAQSRIDARAAEIEQVKARMGFASVHALDLPTTQLDTIPRAEIVQKLSNVVQGVQPDTVLVPFPGDIHSDHGVVFEAAAACTKWFRYPFLRRVMAYETLSETEVGIDPTLAAFRPNVFVEITATLEAKIEIMKIYESEGGAFPFPRSEDAIRALAAVRGVASGCRAAEAYVLLKEVT